MPTNGNEKYGPQLSRQIGKRIDQLEADENLADFERNVPSARCHEYSGKGKGVYSVDLTGNWRLLFRPTDDPPPTKPDGGIDKEQVVAITILEALDPH